MTVRDLQLQQEAIDKISFPEEDEYEDDVDRIFGTTNILKEYFLDLGLDPNDVFRVMAYLSVCNLFQASRDLEYTRQEAVGFIATALGHAIENRKKISEEDPVQLDFFSFLIKDNEVNTCH